MTEDEIRLCVCGWRGTRSALTLHPRQGFGVCPHCWRRGVERTTYTPDELAKRDREMWGEK